MSEYLLQRRAKAMGIAAPVEKKEVYQIPKVSAKQKAKNKAAKPKKDEQVDWFTRQVEKQTGICMECGGSTKSAMRKKFTACCYLLTLKVNQAALKAFRFSKYIKLVDRLAITLS